jgi:hypothetical protein
MRLTRAGTSSTVRRDCPFPTRSGTVRLDGGPLLIPSTMNWITSCLPTVRELVRANEFTSADSLIRQELLITHQDSRPRIGVSSALAARTGSKYSLRNAILPSAARRKTT